MKKDKKDSEKDQSERLQDYRARVLAQYLGNSQSNNMTRVYMAIKIQNENEEGHSQ
ncbi:MAG: hypothetical protein NT150_13990 [Bacteroidetes bacterium]|nr:hypothetical protein [Bacteroidota bacterium]